MKENLGDKRFRDLEWDTLCMYSALKFKRYLPKLLSYLFSQQPLRLQNWHYYFHFTSEETKVRRS